jgi:hypothetical protein
MNIKCPYCNNNCSNEGWGTQPAGSYYDYLACNDPVCLINKIPRFEFQFRRGDPNEVIYYDIVDFDDGLYYSLTFNKSAFGDSAPFAIVGMEYAIRIHAQGGEEYIIDETLPGPISIKDAPQALNEFKTRFKKMRAFL